MLKLFQKVLTLVSRYTRALFLHPVDLGAVAIVEAEGKVVLVRHSYKSGWMFPGGAVDRGEAPSDAVMRELKEEIGLIEAAKPELIGVYMRPGIWASNVVILYRVREARFEFTPSWEIRELIKVDPVAPPDGTIGAVRRRLQEIYAAVPQSPSW
jgi:ADP-ribose pyrophosphatase YjhB (NUDIX family)